MGVKPGLSLSKSRTYIEGGCIERRSKMMTQKIAQWGASSTPNIVREIKWMGMICAGREWRIEEMRNAYEIVILKPERKRRSVSLRHGWEYSIRNDLKRNRVWWCGLDSSGPEQVPVTGCCENYNEHLECMKDGKFLD